MNKRPDDHVPPPEGGEPGAEGEIDSEPRRKWRPDPELLRALAETRKDLRPGEASLFWDWTRTRDSAPEAEDLRPSGEGEVLVSDKEAAAAYVPPKQVSPAAAPRPWTRSRVRFREDLDPRRQPTVRRSRGDGDSGEPRPGAGDAPEARESDVSLPGLPMTVAGPLDGGEPRSSGRRIAWAAAVALVAATVAFLWLQLPPGPARLAAPPEGEGARGASAGGALASGDLGETDGTSGDARHASSLDPGRAFAAPAPPTETPAPRGTASAGATSTARPHAPPPPRTEGRPTPSGPAEPAPKVQPAPVAPPDEGGFLIRRRGDGPR